MIFHSERNETSNFYTSTLRLMTYVFNRTFFAYEKLFAKQSKGGTMIGLFLLPFRIKITLIRERLDLLFIVYR